MLVHIYFKFHEILPASYWETAADGRDGRIFQYIKGNNSKENLPIQINNGRASSQYAGSYLFQVSWNSTS